MWVGSAGKNVSVDVTTADSRESRLPDKFSTRNFPPDGTTFQQVRLFVISPNFSLDLRLFDFLFPGFARPESCSHHPSIWILEYSVFPRSKFRYWQIVRLMHLLQEASYVTFDLSVPRGTSFGLYARRNALPTHTHYNFMEVITGLREQNQRTTRTTEVCSALLLI